MSEFVHLHVHSHYSLLQAVGSTNDILETIKNDGMSAVALTDNSNMFGAIEFYQAALDEEIKPIFGLELRIDPAGITNTQLNSPTYPLVVIAKTYQGYQNLIDLATKSRVDGAYPTPKIDKETLVRHSQDLICLTGNYTSELSTRLAQDQFEQAQDLLSWYKSLFDEVYLELIPLKDTPKQQQANHNLMELSNTTDTPLVLTANSYYTQADKAQAHDIMLAIKNKTTIHNPDRETVIHDDYALKTSQEMWNLCQELGLPEESFYNTSHIADQCQVEIPLNQIQLPYYEVPPDADGNERDAGTYLRHLCQEAIPERYPNGEPEELPDRLELELGIINDTGYPSYFLIVSDFIRWAKDQGILVGPGRGSAAGSLVSYLLGITDLDPLQFNLLFERFLNPARVSMPDIDIDFQDNKRDLVLDYVEKKYGQDHVAQICTFGTMAAKASIRDSGRALGYSYGLCDGVAKLITEKTIAKSLEASPELKARYEQEEKVANLIDNAQVLEGSVRHTSTHACAVVITAKQLTAYTPLQISESGGKTSITTQYEMNAIEDLGLLKMDFLGLANLSIIESTLLQIQAHGKTPIQMTEIPFTDKPTYKLFQKGQTTGVFQFESQGMKKALMQLKPTTFDDLIAMVSLYRPGPMELIPSFIARKHGEEEITYLHPALEKILEPTYGIMIYQEQLMQASQAISGFSLPEADILRKAVGKKKVKLMEEQKVKIIEGAVQNGIEKDIGEKLWELIEPFGNYGFNKSHAACYALIAYQTAYLKAHYPLEFMISLMNSDSSDLTRIAIDIDEARQLGLTLVAPSINTSNNDFSGQETTIYYGLKAIKNFSDKLGELIVQERQSGGKFTSIQNFLDRMPPKEINKKSLEALIYAGAFDEFTDRQTLIDNFSSLADYLKKVEGMQTEIATAQNSLFGDLSHISHPTLQLPSSDLPHHRQLLTNLDYEKTYLGCFLSGHPLDQYTETIEQVSIPSISDILAQKRKTGLTISGIITQCKEITTKKKESMAFIELTDHHTSLEVIVFPSVYKAKKDLLTEGSGLVIKGKLNTKDDQVKFIAEDLISLEDQDLTSWLNNKTTKHVHKPQVESLGKPEEDADQHTEAQPTVDGYPVTGINIPLPENTSQEMLEILKTALTETPKGPCPVYFLLNPHDYNTECLKTCFSVRYSPELIETLRTILNPYKDESSS